MLHWSIRNILGGRVTDATTQLQVSAAATLRDLALSLRLKTGLCCAGELANLEPARAAVKYFSDPKVLFELVLAAQLLAPTIIAVAMSEAEGGQILRLSPP